VWGIGDATIIPFLLNHGVSSAIASLVFLTNPVIGMCLHPMIGKASDTCASPLAKRRPFIISVAIVLVVGCWLQVLTDSLDGAAICQKSLWPLLLGFSLSIHVPTSFSALVVL
jgi:Na+/melibiose symporter-like transporter